MKLTDAQKQAIEYNDGPLLIVAGAGTGKTTVLVEKVVYLLKKKEANPENILLLTFTDKAAREMEDRVDAAVPYGYFDMQISTFHAFADRILREEASHIGISPAYRTLTKTDTIRFLKENIFTFDFEYFRPSGNPHKFLEGLTTHFSRLSDEDISPDQYEKWASKKFPRKSLNSEEKKLEAKKIFELVSGYQTYQQLKLEANVLDFSDLIYYTLKLLRSRANIRASLKKKYTHILVDEFQDTNIAQYELLKLLAPAKEHPHITVVGDDSQSIYKFRGASISNILQYMDYYKKAKNIILSQNFRSSQVLLDTSYKVITHNNPDTLESRLGISKNLRSMVGKGRPNDISFYYADNVEEEADHVAASIEKVIKNEKRPFSDCAILVRAHSHNIPFVAALARRGIPYQFSGPGSLYKLPEIKDLLSYLYVLNDSNDSPSFYRLLSMEIFQVHSVELFRFTSWAKLMNISLFEALHVVLAFNDESLWKDHMKPYKNHQLHLGDATIATLKKIYALVVKGLENISKDTAGQLLFNFIEQAGLLASWMHVSSDRQQKKVENVSKFFNFLKSFEAQHEDASIRAVVEHIQLSMELGESPTATDDDRTANNAVNIMTIHGAKGLEFSHVYLVNLVAGRFPTYNRREQIPLPEELIKEVLPTGDHHLQEERRLFYVGSTRAKNRLTLTASAYYGQGKRQRSVSPFVIEALSEKRVKSIIEGKKEMEAQLTFFEFQKKKNTLQDNRVEIAKDTVFSYSQLHTYQTCPLRYKYQYILKIPMTPSAAASFGSTIHKVLQEYYRIFADTGKAKPKLLATMLEQYWSPIGFTSTSFERSMKKKGISMLKNFHKTHHAQRISIRALEQPFKIKVENIQIVGKIDRVDSEKKDAITIIDYKTGKPRIEKKVENDLQLSIYAMAATDPHLYNVSLEHVSFRYYFLQTNEKWETKVQKEDLRKTKNKLREIAGNIAEKKYKPKVGLWCNYCPFRINCEAWQ